MFNVTNQEFLVCGIINMYFIPNYIPNLVLLFWLGIRNGRNGIKLDLVGNWYYIRFIKATNWFIYNPS